MKKFMVLAALVAMVVAALAIPAMAAQRNFDEDVKGNGNFSGSDHRDRLDEQQNSFLDFVDRFEEQRFPGQDHGNSFDDDNDLWNGNNWWNDNGWWNGNDSWNDVPAVSQRSEQSIESGDSSQTFNVTGGGANSNQCVGIQGISNTGNSVNSTNVLQYASEGGVGVSDSGNFTISPSSTTTCNQQVNQSATAAR